MFKRVFRKVKGNLTDILFVLGLLLVYIALFRIGINLGLISIGISFIYFAISIHLNNKFEKK